MEQILSLLRLLLANSELIILLVAYWIVAWLVKRRASRESLPAEQVGDLSFWLAFGAAVAARLIYILPVWPIYLRYPLDVLRIQTGLSFYGGLGGAILVGWWYARKARFPFWHLADLYALYLPLGIATGRLGCLLDNDCYGQVADPPLGIVFPGMSLPRYPVEIYEAVLVLILFGLLVAMRDRQSFSGQIFLLFLTAYPLIRAFTDVFRISFDSSSIGSDQMISIAVGITALAIWGWRALQEINKQKSASFAISTTYKRDVQLQLGVDQPDVGDSEQDSGASPELPVALAPPEELREPIQGNWHEEQQIEAPI
ncbi:MAG: prolipoprotein diacylglyceryl transferase [Chloroflexi bacterium]|nr:prolipoprotein diacylglyceryl transferase [Chloroflexota bacterium]